MTFGQLLAHVASSSYSYCARGKGEDNPNKEDFQQTRTAKADIVKALNDAAAYCDGVYGGMTDAAAMELVKSGQNLVPKARYLIEPPHDNDTTGTSSPTCAHGPGPAIDRAGAVDEGGNQHRVISSQQRTRRGEQE
jgi:hypothetical protein